jgi:hypothetical protein
MKPEWDTFIQDYLTTGDHIGAYLKAYPAVSRKTAATKGKALLTKAEVKSVINGFNERKTELITHVRDATIISAATERNILTAMELDFVLSQIIRGELKNEKVIMSAGGKPVKVQVAPDMTERIAAIDKLYKRNGAYITDRRNPHDAPPLASKTLSELEAELAHYNELLHD